MDKGKGSASESSSSSDGSNEPNSDQSPPSNFQRPPLTLESGVASFPDITMTQSQHTTSGNRSSFTQWSSRQSLHQLPIRDPSAATFGPQEYRFQNLLGEAGIGSNSFDPIELQNMAIQMRTGLDMGLSLPTELEGINPTNSNGQMKMTLEDNISAIPNHHSLNLLPQGQGSQAQCYGFPFNGYIV
ncbi:hypothetical protein WN943_003394 [Citrus x changshan-huyou]